MPALKLEIKEKISEEKKRNIHINRVEFNGVWI
jgi:hypothetical protein